MGANEPHYDIDLLNELKELYDRFKKFPTAKDINEAHRDGHTASYSTYYRHFGIFQNAIKKMKKEFDLPEDLPESEEELTLF